MNGSSRRVILVCEECGSEWCSADPFLCGTRKAHTLGASAAESSPSLIASSNRG
jgi:hypothetical protein